MEINLVSEGFKFLVLGMSTVFVFLILMVVILHFQAKLINRFFPQKTASAPVHKKTTQMSSRRDDKAIVAAITAAIITFKNSKR